MAMQHYVHGETLEEYGERFKDFAHLERTDDGILLCRLHWKGETPVWSYQAQNAYGELWTAIGHDKKNEIIILTRRAVAGHPAQLRQSGRRLHGRQAPDRAMRERCRTDRRSESKTRSM
jgi:hypothetical protein